MSYKRSYILHYWFDLKDGSRKKGEIPFEAENKLSPEFQFDNIRAMIAKMEPTFPDKIRGDYFIRESVLS